MLLSAGKGAENKRGGNPGGDRIQTGPQPGGETGRANDDLLERLEDGRLGVGHVESVPLPEQDAAGGQLGQFPLRRTDTASRATDDLSQIEGLVRAHQQQRQNRLSGVAEEDDGWIECRTHFGYDCTPYGYGRKREIVGHLNPVAYSWPQTTTPHAYWRLSLATSIS
ncbi:MAG: hypothetical protein ACHRHE_14725 [Tepidisphaerales bacterium]